MAVAGAGTHLDPSPPPPPPPPPPSLVALLSRRVLGPLRRAVTRCVRAEVPHQPHHRPSPALARLLPSSPPPSCLPPAAGAAADMPPPPPDPAIAAIASARDALAALLADGGAGAAAQFDALGRVGRAARAGGGGGGAGAGAPPATTDAARHPANRRKNRYTDVLPYDHTRFVLQQGDDGDGGESPSTTTTTTTTATTTPPPPPPPHAGYINASLIACRPGEVPAWSYIAAQGPLPHTIPDFWRMAVQARCPALVQLTGWTEGGAPKCAPYLPPSVAGEGVVEEAVPGRPGHVRAAWEGGAVAVVAGPATEVAPGVLRREVVITVQAPAPPAPASATTPTPTSTTHALAHLHVGAWPDHGVLPPATLRAVAAALRAEVARAAAAAGAAGSAGGGAGTAALPPPPPPPPLVHCSAGIGRTGTLLAVDIAARRLELAAAAGASGDAAAAATAASRAAALARTVARLRAGRGGMVQTPGQYAAAVAAVVEEAEAWLEKLLLTQQQQQQ